ncbi:MAG TPA: hypothetical protein ENN13_05300 [Candidatus Altiarchaeales archaeon]|nr:hypothetical protein [Candidatus Altiarchaeales archaeon]
MNGLGFVELILLAVLGICVIAIIALILRILQAILLKRSRFFEDDLEVEEGVSESPKTPPESPEPAKNLSPKDEMTQREKKLREREEKMKAEKIAVLKEREAKILGKTKKSDAGKKEMEGVSDGGWFMKTAPKNPKEREAEQIRDLLQRLEKQHEEGIITTEHYETIKRDYERQLIELEDEK